MNKKPALVYRKVTPGGRRWLLLFVSDGILFGAWNTREPPVDWAVSMIRAHARGIISFTHPAERDMNGVWQIATKSGAGIGQ